MVDGLKRACSALAPRMLAAGFAVLFVLSPARADRPVEDCFAGEIGAADYSELSSKFSSGLWSKRTGVKIETASPSLVLTVIDAYSNSVCEVTQDSRTRCQFKASTNDEMTIRVDNSAGAHTGRYRLCAY